MNGLHSPLMMSSGNQRQKILKERKLSCLAGNLSPLPVVRAIKTTWWILPLSTEKHQCALVQQDMLGSQQRSMQDSWTAVCSVLRPHPAHKGYVWYRLKHPANLGISASFSVFHESDLVTQLASIFNRCCRQTFLYLGALVRCTLLQMAMK